MSTPHLYLSTSFVMDEHGRAVWTREPGGVRPPLFSLVRSATAVAWVVRADVPQDIARELDRWARQEPPALSRGGAPVHADVYRSLLAAMSAGDATTSARYTVPNANSVLVATSSGAPDSGPRRAERARADTIETGGPAFEFPTSLPQPVEIVVVHDERLLARNFRGWLPGEIDGGRAPVIAIMQDGEPVSICFCARRSDSAAEAGLETAEAHRGRGFGPHAAAAWALAIRASGRTPLYSTSWTNHASLAVARKLALVVYASHWSVSNARVRS